MIVPGGTKTIEAKGKLVLPGGIDTHTHLEFYFMGTRTADDFYTGTRAALAGGTTTIMNFVLENRSMSLIEAYNLNKSRAEKKPVAIMPSILVSTILMIRLKKKWRFYAKKRVLTHSSRLWLIKTR